MTTGSVRASMLGILGLVLAAAGVPFPGGGRAAATETATPARVLALRGDAEGAWRVSVAALDGSNSSARAAVDLADAAVRLGRVEEARTRARAHEESWPGTEAPGLVEATIARMRSDWVAAEAGFREAAAHFDRDGDAEGALVAREQLAITLQDSGRWAEALALHESNHSHARDGKHPLVRIASAYGIAYCEVLALGRHERAARLAEEARDQARRLRLPLWVGHTEALLGTLRFDEIDVDATLAHLEAARAAYEAAGHPTLEASCLRRIGATHIARGEYPDAIRRLRRGRDLALGAGDRREASFCLEHIGSANHALGDADLATSQWQEALREGGDLWPADWRIGTLMNIGSAEAARGDFATALGWFGRALDALGESETRLSVPDLLVRIARCLADMGKPERALERLDEAVALARELELPRAEAVAFAEIGAVRIARGEIDAAEQALRTAERLVAGRGIPELEIETAVGLAEVSRRRGEDDEALARLETAMRIAERGRGASRGTSSLMERAFGRHDAVWGAALTLLHERSRRPGGAEAARRAFDVAQRARARSLLDLLAESQLDLRFRADPRYREREGELLEALSRLEAGDVRADGAQEIRRLEDELAILEDEIREADPRYAEVRYPRPITVDELQGELLAQDELLLEYFLGDEASFVWAVTRDSFRLERLPGREEIESDVRQLLPLLTDYNLLGDDPTYFLPVAERLSERLLGPVAEELRRAVRVTVVPHGILHYLPFEALLERPVAPGRHPRFADLPWLVARADISYLPATGLRARACSDDRGSEPRTEAPGPASLLIVGDPLPGETGGGVFLRAGSGEVVPARESFAAEIRGLVESRERAHGEVVRLEGANATKTALRDALAEYRPRLVHFTTHGVFNERRPRFSGLLLSDDPGTGGGGFLSIDEVFGLELPCDQVVLSACSTALGREVTGEGLVGLTRAFLYAGARSVVATLWEVPSEPSARLMIEFYDRIASAPDGDRIAALAESKRAVIRSPGGGVERAHPCFWAGFVLTGEGR